LSRRVSGKILQIVKLFTSLLHALPKKYRQQQTTVQNKGSNDNRTEDYQPLQEVQIWNKNLMEEEKTPLIRKHTDSKIYCAHIVV
jgi:hypothetical protein